MINSNYKTETIYGDTFYYAKAFGEWVEVTKEVYDFMTSNDRHMRYLYVRDAMRGCVSLEAICENAEAPENRIFLEDMPCTPAPDDEILEKLCGSTDEFYLSVIRERIDSLYGIERILAMEIFINRRSITEYANAIRVSRKTLKKKVHRLSRELRSYCLMRLEEQYEN